MTTQRETTSEPTASAKPQPKVICRLCRKPAEFHIPDAGKLACPTQSMDESVPIQYFQSSAEPRIKADTLFGIYCNGNPMNVPKDVAVYWEGWQRVADYVNRMQSAEPRTQGENECQEYGDHDTQTGDGVSAGVVSVGETSSKVSGMPPGIVNSSSQEPRTQGISAEPSAFDLKQATKDACDRLWQLAYMPNSYPAWPGVQNIEREIIAICKAYCEQETARLKAVIEHDRTAICDGVNALEKVIRDREWLGEGRGPYEWDDDRWHQEFNDTAVEIRRAFEGLKKIAGDLRDSPTNWDEVQKARGEETARLKAERDSADSIVQSAQTVLRHYAELKAEIARLRFTLRDWNAYAGSALDCYWEQLQEWKSKGATHAEDQLVKRDYELVERLVSAMALSAAAPTDPKGDQP